MCPISWTYGLCFVLAVIMTERKKEKTPQGYFASSIIWLLPLSPLLFSHILYPPPFYVQVLLFCHIFSFLVLSNQTEAKGLKPTELPHSEQELHLLDICLIFVRNSLGKLGQDELAWLALSAPQVSRDLSTEWEIETWRLSEEGKEEWGKTGERAKELSTSFLNLSSLLPLLASSHTFFFTIHSSILASSITPQWENDDELPGCKEAKYIKSGWVWELVKYFCRALTS